MKKIIISLAALASLSTFALANSDVYSDRGSNGLQTRIIPTNSAPFLADQGDAYTTKIQVDASAARDKSDD